MICTKCNINKPEIDFEYGRRQCRVCRLAYKKSLRHSKEYLVSTLFAHHVSRSKQRGHIVGYTLQELRDWLNSQELFNTLYLKWVESGYDKNLVPSIDRTDDYIGYQFDT